MNVLFATPEVAPLAKTGGLADVSGSLPKALSAAGVEVAVVMPLYQEARARALDPVDTGLMLQIPVGDGRVEATIYRSALAGSDVPIYLVANDQYYARPGLFQDDYGDDFADNSERFIFFARAICELARHLDVTPDVIHCNDWQTALVPVYLRTLYRDDDTLGNVGSLLTIHNVAYQGLFWQWDMKLTGLDWGLYNWRELESHGKLNFLKGGIVFADVISTVSRTYAGELLAEPAARGLSGVLQGRQADLYGIVNGVDYSVWDPAADALIPSSYTPTDLAPKRRCKDALRQAAGLAINGDDTPVLAMVSRLAAEKGIDILLPALDRLLARNVQVVVLGTGGKHYEAALSQVASRHPGKAATILRFDDSLAHTVIAGADMFLMPSMTEPSGLTQLYSMKYGTLPIVRRTGGLCDTVAPYYPGAPVGHATGFAFDDFSPDALLDAVNLALETYSLPETWEAIMRTAASQDWSWSRSAGSYAALYSLATAKRTAFALKPG